MSHVQVIRDPAVGGDVPGLHALPGPRQPGGHAARHQRGQVSQRDSEAAFLSKYHFSLTAELLKYGLWRDYDVMKV